jgi:hypothetical protein
VFVAFPIVSMLLVGISAWLYRRRRPSGQGRDRDRIFTLVCTLVPVTLLILWAVLWIFPGWIIPGQPIVPPAVFIVLDVGAIVLSSGWFVVEALIFLIVPVSRPIQP